MSNSPPARDVLTAFGLSEEPSALPGGQGEAWLSGSAVLKPAACAEETRWRAEVLSGLAESPGFRVAPPLPTRDGDWIRDGWEAWGLVAGETDVTRPLDAFAVSRAFHNALEGVARPAFLIERDHAWARSDRIAWGEEGPPEDGLLAAMVERFEPVGLDSQAIHGDLLGNVLYSPGLPPAVIDWSPYFRPAAWAEAIAAVDAVCCHGADESLLERPTEPAWPQLVLRALVFRAATDRIRLGPKWPSEPVREAFRLMAEDGPGARRNYV
ncbi:TIGR02569 family protein [Salininema proteolyticum]|uniref:TIGR02569 family protein n=1 Tax=Salininema proteolyticum TaxID=1607685 RepID=A0ABV8U502_9ACTN